MLTILIGKSGSGKDTALNELCEKCEFKRIVTSTTRPMREGEVNGVDYNFLSKEAFEKKVSDGFFAEYRSYNTKVGGKDDVWFYGSPKLSLEELQENDYVIILDAQGAKDYIDCYGRENCFVVFVNIPDKEREKRAANHGSFEQTEWDSRCLDDNVKFDKLIIKELANYNQDNHYYDAESAAYDICDALEAYKDYNKLFGEQYIVERNVVDNCYYLEPEVVYRVWEKNTLEQIFAAEEEYAKEMQSYHEQENEQYHKMMSNKHIHEEWER